MIYNETVIDIGLIVAYHHKFHHQNKKPTVYRLLVCSFSLASISDIMSIFRRQQRFYPLFLLATAKSALTILTVKCRVFSDFDELNAEKFNGTQLSFVCIFLILDRNWRISAHTLRKV